MMEITYQPIAVYIQDVQNYCATVYLQLYAYLNIVLIMVRCYKSEILLRISFVFLANLLIFIL